MRFMKHAWRYARWPIGVLLIAYAILVVWRIPAVGEKERTAETIQFIQSRELTLADARGDNLPPAPDPVLADATIEGIDANNNYIRDDVELAIFEKYPNDLKLRAAMLQYAMTLQLYLTNVFNEETWKAATQWSDRAYSCISDHSVNLSETHSRQRIVENLEFDSESRRQAYKAVEEYATSYAPSDMRGCD